MKIANWVIAFLIFFSIECIFPYNGICAKEGEKTNERDLHLSKEDVEVIKNLGILEILDFLEEDPELLKDLDVIDKRLDKGEEHE